MNKQVILVFLISLFVVSAVSAADTDTDTDISLYSNVFYAEAFSARTGDEVVLSVKAKTEFELRSYQISMHLPEGLEYVVDDEGLLSCEISANRSYSKKMNFSAKLLNNGDMKVICSSLQGGHYEGLEGEIFTIRLRVTSESTTIQPIQIYAIKAVDPKLNGYDLPAVTFSASLNQYTTGDVNADGKISIDDVACLISIMNNPETADSLAKRRADMDGDNSVTAEDLKKLLQVLLNK